MGESDLDGIEREYTADIITVGTDVLLQQPDSSEPMGAEICRELGLSSIALFAKWLGMLGEMPYDSKNRFAEIYIDHEIVIV